MNTYIYKTKKYMIAQILWDLAGVICLAFSPLLQQWLFDYGLQSPLKKIVMVILAYGALLVFYTLSQYFCALYAFKGGIKFENLLKRDFLYSLFHMESSKFYKHSIGEYVSLQGNDITALEQDYLEPVISIIRCVNMIIVYGVVLFFGVDWRIALVIISSSIFAILIPRMIGKSLTDARSTYQEQMAEYVTEITDLLEGFRVINRMTVGKILDKHEITVGVGVATLSYVSSFIEPIDTVLYNFTAIQSMKDVKKKVLAYTQDTHATVLPGKKKLNSDITLGNVTFKRENFALENVNLTIKKDMKYAVIGHSGAGKTVLVITHDTREESLSQYDGIIHVGENGIYVE